MTLLHVVIFMAVAMVGSAVALTREPRDQAIVLSLYGLVLTVLFLVLQAPDVALSELAVGSAALPLIILVAVAKVRQDSIEPGSRPAKPEQPE